MDKAEGIYFAIKRMWTDKNPLVIKSLEDMTFDEDGYYHFSITPQDTEQIPYGKYVWDFTAVEDNEKYRAKPAHGYFVIGNSSVWIVNETEA